ncbi:MAG: hypothetical protein SGPRY_014597 [Prymnesium sp.]
MDFGVSSLEACKTSCTLLPSFRCEAVLFSTSRKCYRKRHVDLAHCSDDSAYSLHLRTTARPPSLATPLIIDTDMGFDVDDAMALCMAHALHDLGEARLIGVLHSYGYPKGIAAASVLSHWYGHDDVPLGAYKGTFGRDVEHPNEWKTGDYVPMLTGGRWNMPVDSSERVADASDVYRAALAGAEDGSVVIAALGFATNLANLLTSGGDEHSPLTGVELVRAKVRRVVWQGGWYPARHQHEHPQPDQEFNWGCGSRWFVRDADCEGSASFVVEHLPETVEQVFSEDGFFMPTGGALMQCASEANPCRQALETNMRAWGLQPSEGRASWDALVTLVAVRGAEEVGGHLEGLGGFNLIDPNGTNVWHAGSAPQKRQSYLRLEGDNHWKVMEEKLKKQGHAPAAELELQREINRLLCRPSNAQGE